MPDKDSWVLSQLIEGHCVCLECLNVFIGTQCPSCDSDNIVTPMDISADTVMIVNNHF